MTATDKITPAAELRPAHVIRSDAEAIEIAESFGAELALGASQRDKDGGVPHGIIRRLAETGLLGISVPRAYGGADVSNATIAEVFRLLAAGDSAIAQLPQNHFVFVEVLTLDGTPEQKSFLFSEVLKGARFGNALSERHSKHVFALTTRLTRQADGTFRLNGTKYYTTGALTAQYIPVFALDDEENLVVAYVDRHAKGVTATDDWYAMGQKATVSGTTAFDDVVVTADRLVPHSRRYETPQVFGAFGQLIHAAIDVGIAEAALKEGADFIANQSRPWFESGLERNADEPHILLRFGQLGVRFYAAQELLRKAARVLDDSKPNVNAQTAAQASLGVAAAKAFAGDAALEITNEIFSLSGTRAADDRSNLHRHWRNARTHTLHDPNRWKYHHIGNYLLNGTLPPNHGLI